jgi:hypothetical protein
VDNHKYSTNINRQQEITVTAKPDKKGKGKKGIEMMI